MIPGSAPLFGLFSIIGLAAWYLPGFAPSQEYQPESRPRLLLRKEAGGDVVRGAVIGLAGTIAGGLTHQGVHGAVFGLEIGLVVAAVGAIVATVSPYVEW